MTGRGDWGDGGDLAKAGGKKGRKSGSWKDISSPGPLVCSPLCPWPLPPQCRGQLPSSPAVPSSVKRQSPGHPRVRSRWWGSGRPPPPRASISALEPPGSEQRACVGVGGHPDQFSKLWPAKPFLLWFPGERKAICKTGRQPVVDCSD